MRHYGDQGAKARSIGYYGRFPLQLTGCFSTMGTCVQNKTSVKKENPGAFRRIQDRPEKAGLTENCSDRVLETAVSGAGRPEMERVESSEGRQG